jgi:hypothetical protein
LAKTARPRTVPVEVLARSGLAFLVEDLVWAAGISLSAAFADERAQSSPARNNIMQTAANRFIAYQRLRRRPSDAHRE